MSLSHGWWIAVLVACTLAAAACGADQDAESRARRDCATKSLYDKTLRIRVVGDSLACSEIRDIIRGRCQRGKVWSCLSLRSPDPLLIWFKEQERFKRPFSNRRSTLERLTVDAFGAVDERERSAPRVLGALARRALCDHVL